MGRRRAAAGSGVDRPHGTGSWSRDERLLDLRTGVLVRTGATGRGFAPCGSCRPPTPRRWRCGPRGRPLTSSRGHVRGAGRRHWRWSATDRGPVRLARTADPAGGGIAVAARDWQQVTAAAAGWSSGWPPGWPTRPGRRTGTRPRPGWPRSRRSASTGCWPSTGRRGRGGGPTPRSRIEGSAGRRAGRPVRHVPPARRGAGRGEAAVGARGLTGPAYGGHVFWDADVFVLPALAAIRPAAARAMLEYRIRRLPPPGPRPRAAGLDGARFPWESAGDGTDVTPRSVRGRNGELIPIRTGSRRSTSWPTSPGRRASTRPGRATPSFLAGAGGEPDPRHGPLLGQPRPRRRRRARPPVRRDGPDEYHEVVDDNAYTNVMARWNLRRAAELVDAARRRRRRGGALAAARRSAGRRLGPGAGPVRAVRRLLGPRAAAGRRRRPAARRRRRPARRASGSPARS